MKKAGWLVAVIIVFSTTILGATGCTSSTPVETEELTRFEETRTLMDTFFTITVYTSDEENAQAVINDAFNRMEEIEREASIFDEQTEAFKLNQDGYLETPSADFRQMINMSLDYSQITDGYFDITVQPLLNLWQAGLWQESESVQQSRIDETLALVGWYKIGIEDARIFFTVDGMEITLGGIAKGYAVDEALDVFNNAGVEHALINAGGDMRMLGTKPQGEPWLVALVNPDDTSQSLAEFSLSDKAIATSGNYERYFNPEKTAHHIINPKTGYSAAECISTTVIAPSATMADALATSIYVMGPEAGITLIESLDDAECLIVDANRAIHLSSGLSQYLVSAS
ncbi:MAG: FAD:protein FMN transferase [Dehalococcoidales bacterium]|nr:FAD:protein FMN transferase [Dehalococcoidales bacterium]